MPDIDYVVPPVPARTMPERIYGTILLSYRDPDLRINVTSEERHIVCAEPSPYDDGLHDFEAADYAAQRDALLHLLDSLRDCEMVFRVEADFAGRKEPESLYFAKIYRGSGPCFAEVDPYYLDPTGGLNSYIDGLNLSSTAAARQAYDLLYGGFVAAEIDHMDNAWSHKDRMGEVNFFRRALENAREPIGLLSALTHRSKRPLATQIRSAQEKGADAEQRPPRHYPDYSL